MMSLKCSDLMPGDDFVATGETKEEVMAKSMEHVAAAHGDMWNAMSPEDQAAMKTKAESMIHDDGAAAPAM